MAARLYVVNGSHPCVTVAEALRLKGVPFRTVEFPPPTHAVGTRLLGFGGRTVPAIRFDDGEKLQGSVAILRRLEGLRPDPPLYGSSAEERSRIEEAETWGDEVLQPLVRRVLWPALGAKPEAIHAFQQGSKLPALPLPLIRLNAPVIVAIEKKMNASTAEVARRDVADLPGHLDRIEAWMGDGVLGGERPNAADLQIAPSLRLLQAIEDLAPLFEGRPAAELVTRVLSPLGPSVPRGALPAAWLPAAADPSRT
jgi:glutathione S-transferase